jgi:hypothetical protein
MSGFVDEEFIRIKLLDAYAGFLPKPMRAVDLLAAVRQAIGEGTGGGVPGQWGEKASAAGA